MRFSDADKNWMRLALDLAAKGVGLTRPNPAVGAVLVKGSRLLAKGYHKAAGAPHAEAIVLRRAGAGARGATLYVNLEPCSHFGRTPSCADHIIRAGVRRVVASLSDPNPLVGGEGIERLRNAGIRVDVGLFAEEAERLNEPFLTYHRLGRPLFVAKWAMTLDGRLSTRSGDSRWISNEQSRLYVHELRARYDAVMVGVGTVLTDNPHLNARLVRRRKVIQPTRIIVDDAGKTPLDAHCLDPADAGPTIVATTVAAPDPWVEKLRERGVTVLTVAGGEGTVDVDTLSKRLYDQGIQSVLCEGGRRLLTSLFEADVVDRVVAFVAPKIVGGDGEHNVVSGWGVEQMTDAVALEDVGLRNFGTDVCVEGRVKHE